MFDKKAASELQQTGEDFGQYIHTMQDDLAGKPLPIMDEPPQTTPQQAVSSGGATPDANTFPSQRESASLADAIQARPSNLQPNSPFFNGNQTPPPAQQPQQPANLPVQPLQEIQPPKEDAPRFSEPAEPAGEVFVQGQSTNAVRNIRWSRIFILGTLSIIICAISAGGYYFWITRASQTNKPQAPETPSSQETVNINSNLEKYSLTKPNPLQIDMETATPENIKALLSSTASDVQKIAPQAPLSFVVTDSNNNPVAFSRFAYAAGITLPEQVLSDFDESFMLYLSSDSGNARLGVSIATKNKDRTFSDMLSNEKTLSKNMSLLLLDSSVETADLPFQDSSYKDYAIRYQILNAQNTLSFDYTFTQTNLLISTSKNTLHAIIDSLSAPQILPPAPAAK